MNFSRKSPAGDNSRNSTKRIAPLSGNRDPEARTSKARLLPNTRKDIEVNRLTLGK